MKKKLISIFILAAMLATMFVLPASADKTLGASTTTSLNMRKSASTSSAIMTTMPKGTEVIVLSTEKSWSKIIYNNQIGYAYSSYLTADKDVSGKFGTGTISGTDVRMRKGAGTSYSIIGTYGKGTKMTVTGASGNWYKVSYNSTTGYVCADYMTISVSSSSSSSSSSTSTTTKTYTGKIIGTDVRMRSGAGTSYSILGTYSSGVTMTVYSSTNGWYKVKYDGKTGYVYGSYMHITPTTAYSENKNGTITGSGVRMRMGPSTDFSIVTELSKGTSVKISGEYANWYEVSVNGKYGYVCKDYLKISAGLNSENSVGTVTGSAVRIRKGPGTSYDIVGYCDSGAQVIISGKSGNWYAISYNNINGYICADYVSTGANSDLANRIIATAKEYLGTPYVYGGASPDGFDCSGFVHYIYEQFGYHLERGATSQYNTNGVKVDKSNLKPADLVFFSDSVDPIGHVGIYIGDGQFIHASSGKGCVTINKLDDYYYCEHYTAAKRII